MEKGYKTFDKNIDNVTFFVFSLSKFMFVNFIREKARKYCCKKEKPEYNITVTRISES
jgi:hypothetical protein